MLLRRRQIWVPTFWGFLLLVIVMMGMIVGFALTANGLLAPNAPAAGKAGAGARTLVIEGWMNPVYLPQAVEAFHRGHYERVLTTGGPMQPWADVGGWGNFAARAAANLHKYDLGGVPIIVVPAPDSKRERSYVSALMVGEWAKRSGLALGSIDLFTLGAHARRSQMLYRMALGRDVEVGVMAASPLDYDAQRWWDTSMGAKTTLGEAFSVVWTMCCFWPGTSESRETP
jgi:hypothetical protein